MPDAIWIRLADCAGLVFWLSPCPSRRVAFPAVALLAFGVLIAPWLVRNYAISGTLFGTAGYAVFQGMLDLEGDRVERSLQPVAIDVTEGGSKSRKFLANLLPLRHDLPRLTGSWVSAFFLVGLLLPFSIRGGDVCGSFLWLVCWC
jgi:hypothetical protein